jgi:hypothetical protein
MLENLFGLGDRWLHWLDGELQRLGRSGTLMLALLSWGGYSVIKCAVYVSLH